MYGKLITAMAFALGTGTAAMAQTTTDPLPEGGTGDTTGTFTMPEGWGGNIGDSLFSDPMTGTARDRADITTNWGNLSADEQRLVREHCATLNGDAAGQTGMDGTTTGTDTTGNETTGAETPGTDMTDTGANASIRDICDSIQGL